MVHSPWELHSLARIWLMDLVFFQGVLIYKFVEVLFEFTPLLILSLYFLIKMFVITNQFTI